MLKVLFYALVVAAAVVVVVVCWWAGIKVVELAWNGVLVPTLGIGGISFKQAFLIFLASWVLGGISRVVVSR